jgi:hypothetical protein
MALFLKQDEEKTELQQKIAMELQDKLRKKDDLTTPPDFVDDSAYLKGTKKTTTLAFAWVLIVIAIVVITVYLTVTALDK